MNTILNNLSEADKNKSFLTIYKDGAKFDIKISDLLAILSSLQILASVDGSNGIYAVNTSTGPSAGSQLLLGNDTGASAQWYSGSSTNGYGANILFLRQMKNAPFRFVSDSGNSFYFGTDLYGASPYLTIASTVTNINSALTVGSATTLDASAALQVNSTTKGTLMARMTTGQINAIASPANGLIVYNTDLFVICFYDGTGWKKVSHTAM